MNQREEDMSTHLPVSLSGARDATRSSDGRMAGTLTVPCPVARHQVLLQRCAFCARSDRLFQNPEDGALTLRCRVPADRS